MIITRSNYEEYFILYMDNELESDDRGRVELFVQENPDLQSEFDLLLHSRLSPDTSLVFDDKESLLQIPVSYNINDANYEEWLLLYTDNELTEGQRRSVEQYASTHPPVQQELYLLQKTKLVTEQIVFPGKESLYRKEQKTRVILINWKRVAIAAALLIGVSTTALLLSRDTTIEETVATIPSSPGNLAQQPRDDQRSTQSPVIADQKKDNDETVSDDNVTIPETASQDDKGGNTQAGKDKKVIPVPVIHNDPVLADVEAPKRKSNDLPEPRYNPNVIKNVQQDNPIAMAETTGKDPLTNIKENTSSSFVTPDNSQSLNNVVAAASIESDETTNAAEPGKKNKLRGFFRKVTRTFEKATNIKATDDEDRLLLGGLAIKL